MRARVRVAAARTTGPAAAAARAGVCGRGGGWGGRELGSKVDFQSQSRAPGFWGRAFPSPACVAARAGRGEERCVHSPGEEQKKEMEGGGGSGAPAVPAPPPPPPAAADAPAPPPAAALREDQIQNAVAFLTHPRVRCVACEGDGKAPTLLRLGAPRGLAARARPGRPTRPHAPAPAPSAQRAGPAPRPRRRRRRAARADVPAAAAAAACHTLRSRRSPARPRPASAPSWSARA